jgi:hypothetical protein
MKALFETISGEVAGGRLASSAQHPRATSFPTLAPLPQPMPQPISSTSFLDTPDALLEGLRCFTAYRPLPDQNFPSGKITEPWLQ